MIQFLRNALMLYMVSVVVVVPGLIWWVFFLTVEIASPPSTASTYLVAIYLCVWNALFFLSGYWMDEDVDSLHP